MQKHIKEYVEGRDIVSQINDNPSRIIKFFGILYKEKKTNFFIQMVSYSEISSYCLVGFEYRRKVYSLPNFEGRLSWESSDDFNRYTNQVKTLVEEFKEELKSIKCKQLK